MQLKHYKGGLYTIKGFATHTETLETLVIYQDSVRAVKTWARPLTMFFETVQYDGKEVKRFEVINE